MQDLKNIVNSSENNQEASVDTQEAPKGLAPDNNISEATKTPETVPVDKKVFEGMLARIEKLEKGGYEKPNRVQEDRAFVRLLDGKIITNIGRMWTEQKMSKLNPEDENRLFAKMVTEDEKEHDVDFVHFLEDSERLFGFIKKREQKDATRNHGSTLTEPQDPYGNRMSHKQSELFEAELIERKTDDTFILEIAEGERAKEEISVHHSVLNL